MTYRPLLCILLAALAVSTLPGQFYDVTRYADEEGISRIVRGVTQDRNGFLWVAGQDGLFKYDGQQFKAYHADLSDTLGLRNNRISMVLESVDRKIWIGTLDGLHYLDIETNQIHFKPLKADQNRSQAGITYLFEDRDQNLWVGTYDGMFII
ncbi:MAG: two-component regulator propeller domain-containing protein, partial [Bacteroidota bacterium]